MKKLYRFYVDCGRMGELEGLFIRDEKDIKDAIGKEVWFHDVLGKHSEIGGPLEASEITVVTDDQDYINKTLELIGPHISGIDPIDYMEF
jgi:hypothetical protein